SYIKTSSPHRAACASPASTPRSITPGSRARLSQACAKPPPSMRRAWPDNHLARAGRNVPDHKGLFADHSQPVDQFRQVFSADRDEQAAGGFWVVQQAQLPIG